MILNLKFLLISTFLLVNLGRSRSNVLKVPQIGEDFEDVSELPTVFESKSLPVDEDGNFLARQMASVGNGHVSTTVYTDTVYMNGLYNGERGESHRARIPSGNNILVDPQVEVQNQSFALDVERGTFFERFSVNGAQVEQRTYAHRYYTKLIVTQVKVTTSSRDLVLYLTSSPGSASADLNTPTTGDFGTQLGATYSCAETLQKEDPRYQEKMPQACTISSALPNAISVPAGSSVTRTFITAYGFDLDSIASDFNAVASLIVEDKHDEIFESHLNAWRAVWQDGRIEVEGNLKLAKVVYGSLYYILSSLPVTTATHSPAEQFYGLSPGGLAYGSLLMDYQGHSFWDTETWMYPPVLYLYPKAAKEILSYRLAVTRAARDHANATGFKGARFPWESGVTGREVTPDCCPETRDLQVHISSDISYAIRQYISMTRDVKFLTETQSNYVTNGCGLLRDIAEFWTTRSTYNSTTGYYDIKGVMPPDEDNHGVDNNGYTNIGAAYSIFYAKYAECLCNQAGGAGGVQEVPEEWLQLAKSLKLLYDEEKDYHPEYEGYQFGTSIKQADVVLMGFPQLYDMKPSTRRNDLLIYANATREDGPAMTWSMHSIGFLELDDMEEATRMFERSYQWYMREPFKVWTEIKPPFIGAINFITGMGGFLQSIFTGFGGIRVYPEKITITKPRVLPNSSGLVINGLKYLGNVIDVNISEERVILTLREASSEYPLQISHENDVHPTAFIVGTSMSYSTTDDQLKLEITTRTPTNCPLPHDQIGESRTTRRVREVPSMTPADPQQGWESTRYQCTQPGLFAITFDDGPSKNGETEKLLDVLKEKGVKVTFFVTGYGHDGTSLITDPRKQDVLRRIHQEGHEIASHTFSHDSLIANRTREDIISDIELIANTVHDIIGVNLTMMRPPYGDVNDTVIDLIKDEFQYDIITWNLDTNDWQHREEVDVSFGSYLLALEKASSETNSFIALHHDPVVRSGELASMAIDYVRLKGYKVVTVSECLGKNRK